MQVPACLLCPEVQSAAEATARQPAQVQPQPTSPTASCLASAMQGLQVSQVCHTSFQIVWFKANAAWALLQSRFAVQDSLRQYSPRTACSWRVSIPSMGLHSEAITDPVIITVMMSSAGSGKPDTHSLCICCRICCLASCSAPLPSSAALHRGVGNAGLLCNQLPSVMHS